MRTWFKRLIKRWYMGFCDPDLVSMTRIQLAGVGPDVIWRDLSREEQDTIVNNADILLKNKAFNLVIDRVMSSQRDYAINYSQNFEEVKFGRGQISGASLVREVVESFASMTEEEKEQYNRFDPV